jgi:hypothetical protein
MGFNVGLFCCGGNESYEEKFRTCERRILRSIYGAVCEYGVWRIKYNDGLYGLHKSSYSQSNKSSQVKKARAFSQIGGTLRLQKDNLLAA